MLRISSEQISSLYYFVGKTGFARVAHTFRFCAVSRYEELCKTGKLAENRRFFAKALQPQCFTRQCFQPLVVAERQIEQAFPRAAAHIF